MTDERPPSEAELLVPWSLTRKLNDAEEAMVQAAMEMPDFANQISLAEDERRGSVEISERIPGPSRQSLDKLMNLIDAEPKRTPGLWSKVKAAFNSFGVSGAPAGVVMAGLAMVVFVQGGLLTQTRLDDTLVAPEPIGVAAPSLSAPATTQQSPTRNLGVVSSEEVVVHVVFQPEATMSEVAALLNSLDGQIIAGPSQNSYTVIFMSKASATMALSVFNSTSSVVQTAQPQE